MRGLKGPLIILSLLASCSRDVPIAIPEPYPASVNAPSGDGTAGGDDAGQIGGVDGTLPGNGTDTPDAPGGTGGSTNTSPVVNHDPLPEPTRVWFPEPHEAVGDLVSMYDRNTGLWPDGYHSSAYSMLAVVDYMARTKTLEFTWMLDHSYGRTSFLTPSFEENAAWAITWVKAYDLTRENRYLDLAKTIQDGMQNTGWDDTCGGGFYAKSDKTQKSAAANLLYTRLAVLLYERTNNNQAYLDSAIRTWNWLKSSPLLAGTRLVKNAQNSDCTIAESPLTTYNQGAILGALTALNKATNDQSFLEEAKAYYEISQTQFFSQNTLVEKNISDCQSCSTESMYKGAYAYYLGVFNEVAKIDRIRQILGLSGEAAWSKKGSGALFGYNWQSGFDAATSGRQTSGALLLNVQITKPFENNFARQGDTRTSAICMNAEDAAKAYDGSAATKWCGQMINGINHLSVDVGAQRVLKTVRILHAGAGQESRSFNTKDFELQTSQNGSDFTTIATIRGNESSMTLHKVQPVQGRYLRLRFTTPGSDNTGRIYEITAE